jgi:hypothetical protein
MDDAGRRYVALKRRRRRARNRAAGEGSGARKAADSGRQRTRAGIGATLADVWPRTRS